MLGPVGQARAPPAGVLAILTVAIGFFGFVGVFCFFVFFIPLSSLCYWFKTANILNSWVHSKTDLLGSRDTFCKPPRVAILAELYEHFAVEMTFDLCLTPESLP